MICVYEFALVVCIEHGRTRGSVELLVEVLAGKTRIPAHHALSQLTGCDYDAAYRRRLEADADFKPAMFRFAEHGSWLERGTFADVAATMGWQDAVLLLEAMLEDGNQSLRISAAKALGELTGKHVEPERSEASFCRPNSSAR